MAYYRVITPAGHLARGTVVTDEPERGTSAAGSSALFAILPKTAAAMVQSGALEPIPDPVGPVQEEPGWAERTKDKEAQQSVAREARAQRRRSGGGRR